MGHLIKKYLWIVGLVCSVLIGLLLAKTLVILIEDSFFQQSGMILAKALGTKEVVQAQKTKILDVDAILKRNFFDPEETILTEETPLLTEETEGSETVPAGQAVQTTLPIKLLSTISTGDGQNEYSSCVVTISNKPGTYTIRDKNPFGNSTKIVRILAKRVEFTNSGRLEFVDLEDFAKLVDLNKRPDYGTPAKSAENSTTKDTSDIEVSQEGDTFQVARADLEKAMEDLPALQKDIRITLNYDAKGKPAGFKILSIRRGSIFEKLGMRRYDILKSVNGQTLDIQNGFSTFNSLKNETEFELELERGGQVKVFKYQVI